MPHGQVNINHFHIALALEHFFFFFPLVSLCFIFSNPGSGLRKPVLHGLQNQQYWPFCLDLELAPDLSCSGLAFGLHNCHLNNNRIKEGKRQNILIPCSEKIIFLFKTAVLDLSVVHIHNDTYYYYYQRTVLHFQFFFFHSFYLHILLMLPFFFIMFKVKTWVVIK